MRSQVCQQRLYALTACHGRDRRGTVSRHQEAQKAGIATARTPITSGTLSFNKLATVWMMD